MKIRRAIAIILPVLMLWGCGDLEDMINGATERTFTISQTIHDATSERDYKSATMVANVHVVGGETLVTDTANLEELADRLEVSRLGLADVRFYVTGKVINYGGGSAIVNIGAVPTGGTQVYPIGSVAVGPGSTVRLSGPGQMMQDAAVVDANLRALVADLGDDYLLTPVVQAESGDVVVERLRLTALPTYLRERAVDDDSLAQYQSNIKEIANPELTGTVTNEGAGAAYVAIYLPSGDVVDPEIDRIAEAVLQPGESIEGEEMLLPDGDNRIKQAFKNVMAGETVAADFVVISPQAVVIRSDELKVKITVTVDADVF